MRQYIAICVILAIASSVHGRVLTEKRELSELPATITCPGSLLYSAEIVDARYACSPAYYNCLGVPAGGVGQLSYCQDGLVFDKFYFTATETFPNGQGGACNYATAACGTSPAGAPSSPTPPSASPAPTTPTTPASPVPELPTTISCPGSLLYSAEIVNKAYACSAAYYNCLGVPVGGTGVLSFCQTGLVFDKTSQVATETFPNGQGGACNWSTPACT